ncbi:T9SS type A sorting domain-containing protein [Chitinophagaceae bacterium MMS25-I14]
MKKTFLRKAANALLACAAITQVHAQSQSNVAIHKLVAKPNPTGMALGFWEVFSGQQLTLDSIGKRPTSRVDFRDWDTIEDNDTAGLYHFQGVFDNFKKAHNYGETILGAVNVCFTDKVTPNKRSIPSYYNGSISNPTTRAAAIRFIKAYVREALTEVGALTLTIDYEVCSNYKLSSPDTSTDKRGMTRLDRATEWGNWYADASAAARFIADSMGMSNRLKLQPIVNGNPLDPGNPISQGPTHNPWLIQVVDSSDYLALDTYQSDSIYSNTSAQTTFNIIKFWTDSFSHGKGVIVTENGFNTVTSYDPGKTREDRGYKTTGTEADQATFYTNIFNQLSSSNAASGIFHNKLRSYNIWSICDNITKDTSDEDYYFGIVGMTKTAPNTYVPYAKPALAVVRNGYNYIDTSAFNRPYSNVADTTVSYIKNATNTNYVTLNYNNGDDFDFLRYTATLPAGNTYYLHVQAVNTCNFMVHVNKKWLYFANRTQVDTDITAYCISGTNTVDVYCTGEKFPFVQQVKTLRVNNSVSKPAPQSVATVATEKFSVYPNPAHTAITISGINTSQTFRTEVFNMLGQRVLSAANSSEVGIAALAQGNYVLKVYQGDKTYTASFVKE